MRLFRTPRRIIGAACVILGILVGSGNDTITAMLAFLLVMTGILIFGRY